MRPCNPIARAFRRLVARVVRDKRRQLREEAKRREAEELPRTDGPSDARTADTA